MDEQIFRAPFNQLAANVFDYQKQQLAFSPIKLELHDAQPGSVDYAVIHFEFGRIGSIELRPTQRGSSLLRIIPENFIPSEEIFRLVPATILVSDESQLFIKEDKIKFLNRAREIIRVEKQRVLQESMSNLLDHLRAILVSKPQKPKIISERVQRLADFMRENLDKGWSFQVMADNANIVFEDILEKNLEQPYNDFSVRNTFRRVLAPEGLTWNQSNRLKS